MAALPFSLSNSGIIEGMGGHQESSETHALTALADAHGRTHADPDRQAELLAAFWQSTRSPAATKEGALPAELLQELPEATGVGCPPPVSAADLTWAFTQMRTGSAAGADGWRVEELRVRPPQAHHELSQIIALSESTVEFPSYWTQAIVMLIPKVDHPPQPHQLRPTSDFPAIWRALDKKRCRQLAMHIDGVLHRWQHSARVGRSPHDPINTISHHIDKAILGAGDHIYGISLDLVKCLTRSLTERSGSCLHIGALTKHRSATT